jgi:diguanylate cyclase (GGDEF)-like protein
MQTFSCVSTPYISITYTPARTSYASSMQDSNSPDSQPVSPQVDPELIEFILELTACTEINTLAETLIRILKHRLRTDAIFIYRLSYKELEEDTASDPAALARVYTIPGEAGEGEPLSEHPVLEKVVRLQQPVLEQDNDKPDRYAYPMFGQNGINYLLYVSDTHLDETRIRQIEILWKVWQHLYSLVERNELDALTGLLNRVAFDNRLQEIFSQGRHSHRRKDDEDSRVLALIDIDHFKAVNDEFGHLLGDEVLVQLSRLMSSSFRGNDMVFRFGGEEFVVILRNCTLETAHKILDRFRKKASAYVYPQIGHKTVSIGITRIDSSELPTTILDRADKALYFSKQNGRNQCNV